MNQSITRLFGLPGFLVDTLDITATTVMLRVRSPRRRAHCPRCEHTTTKIHQYHQRTVKHSLIDGKPVLLRVEVRRFFCQPCQRPFTEQLPGIDRHDTTLHYRQHALRTLATHSISGAARETVSSPTTLTDYLDDFGEQYAIDWERQGHTISLGLDEHSRRRRRMAGTVTNLTRHELLAVLPSDTQASFRSFLHSIPKTAQRRIKEVCIDMRRSFRTVIEECLPYAKIVVDPFHLVRLANDMMDEVRSVVLGNTGPHPGLRRLLFTNREDLEPEEQAKLHAVFRQTAPFPSLKVAWTVKEKIRDMYHSRNRKSAEKKFVLILGYLEDVESRYLKSLRRTLVRWQPYILNHFDHRTTNAFTEGCHTKIKMIKRLSFGFRNIDRYRAKMVLGFRPEREIMAAVSPH